MKNGLVKKLKYPQPHSIKLVAENEALTHHYIMKEHVRRKYLASKWNKRLYANDDGKRGGFK